MDKKKEKFNYCIAYPEMDGHLVIHRLLDSFDVHYGTMEDAMETLEDCRKEAIKGAFSYGHSYGWRDAYIYQIYRLGA